MVLKTQQGIIIYSPEVINGEKLQGLIKLITPDFITINIPIGNIEIKSKTELFINFWDDNATYEFKTIALSSKPPTENLMNIAKPTTLKKVFNRNFPRIKINTAGEIFDFNGYKPYPCMVVNISGGGVCITAQPGRKIGEIIKLDFSLPNDEHLGGVSGKINWMKPVPKSLINYGIKFQTLSEIRRQKIISFVNEKIINKQKNKDN